MCDICCQQWIVQLSFQVYPGVLALFREITNHRSNKQREKPPKEPWRFQYPPAPWMSHHEKRINIHEQPMNIHEGPMKNP